jgi:hypothetical protein
LNFLFHAVNILPLNFIRYENGYRIFYTEF